MFNKSILEPTLFSFNILQCKTDVTCSFPNFCSLFQSLQHVKMQIQYTYLQFLQLSAVVNLLMPNDDYSGRTAPLTSKCCNLYIYSTNIGTEHFKHGIYSPFFPLQNAVCFINLTYLVPVLVILYIQNVLKLKQ